MPRASRDDRVPSLDVLHGGQFLNKPKLLPERSQLTTLASGSLSQWFSLPMQSALIRLKRAVAEADQRTFARPAATEQNNPLAVVNLQVDGLKPSGQACLKQLQYRHQRILPSSRPTASIAT